MLSVYGEFSQTRGPRGQASFSFPRGVGFHRTEACQGNDAGAEPGGGFQHVIVLASRQLPAAPGKAEGDGTIHPIPVHGFQQRLGRGQLRPGSVIEQFELGFARKETVSIRNDFRGKMCV